MDNNIQKTASDISNIEEKVKLEGLESSEERIGETYSQTPVIKIAEAVIEVNRVFSFLYRDLWLKDAEDEGYLENWVESLFEEGLEPKSILNAVDAIKHDQRFETYPPNFAQFLEACRSQERVNYNLPTKEEAYMIACGKRDISIRTSHSVVQETVRRVEEFRIKHDPNVRSEFFRVYSEVCKEFTDNEGNVSFNLLKDKLDDFQDEEREKKEPPVSKDVAKMHLRDLLNR